MWLDNSCLQWQECASQTMFQNSVKHSLKRLWMCSPIKMNWNQGMSSYHSWSWPRSSLVYHNMEMQTASSSDGSTPRLLTRTNPSLSYQSWECSIRFQEMKKWLFVMAEQSTWWQLISYIKAISHSLSLILVPALACLESTLTMLFWVEILRFNLLLTFLNLSVKTYLVCRNAPSSTWWMPSSRLRRLEAEPVIKPKKLQSNSILS